MPRECAASDCRELAMKGTPYSFHQFPRNQELRLQWAQNINRKVHGTGKLWMPCEHDVVCSKHFTDECFTMQYRLCRENGIPALPRLEPHAVPTLFSHTEEKRKRLEAASDRRSAVAVKKQKREYLQQVLGEMNPVTSESTAEVSEAADENKENFVPSNISITTPAVQLSISAKDAAVQIKPSQVSREQQTAVHTSTAHKATNCPSVYYKEQGTQTECQEGWCPCTCHPDVTSQGSQTDHQGPIINCETDDENEDTSDCNWEPPLRHQSNAAGNIIPISDLIRDRKYIVFENQLLDILSVCRHCARPCTVAKKSEYGTSVAFDCVCKEESCAKKFTWHSQPFSSTMPLGNLVLAAAAFFTACSPSRLINTCLQANIACFTTRTFFRVQETYLLPAVRIVWGRCQERMFAARTGRTVKLAGDGRCDSPGHCAKYGSYTFMDASTSEVLHCELVQSNQVRNSHAMELEGLKKGLQNLDSKISTSHLITDRHVSIKKFMSDNFKGDVDKSIAHHFDIWHVAKGIQKKIEAAGKSKRNACLAVWSKSISRHLYWCSTSTPEGPNRPQIVADKWLSMLNHVADIHEGHGGTYPACQHGQLDPRVWIKKGTSQHRILEGIIKNKCLLRDIGMLSPDAQTATLESYHAVVCHFAPKLNAFTYPVMQAKLLLAAMHFNENASHQQATNVDGELQWKIARPRGTKGVPVAKPIKEDQTRCYIIELMEEVAFLRHQYPTYAKAKLHQDEYVASVPLPLNQTAEFVDKSTIIACHRPRMNWRETLSSSTYGQ